jgi:intracellular sulfur oxidation DsrE/DsrF family protein
MEIISMKKIIRFLLLSLVAVFFSTSLSAQNTEVKHKVVVQLNTADTTAWSSTIGNIKNLQKLWPGNLVVEVVIHGKALGLLVAAKTHLANEVIELSKANVQFLACENSMRKYHIDKSELLTIANTIPSGVAELILKQEAGWSYLKAGVN